MATGPTIDGFEELTLIGRGASGTVYRAHQGEMNRQVAIKILSATTTDPNARERFRREVRALGELSGHPNIVTVYTSGTTDDDQPYLVMGLMERDITGVGPVDEDTAVDYIGQVAKGLAVAHDAGVLHRDIKPANIFLDRYGTLRLGDFGLVGLSDTATMTQSSVGSPAYMAPELLGNSRASAASDIYALGVTLYELVEGALPFRMGAGGVAGLLHTIISADPEPPTRMSAGLATFVHRCLAKDPAERPQSVAEFLADLHDLLEFAFQINMAAYVVFGETSHRREQQRQVTLERIDSQRDLRRAVEADRWGLSDLDTEGETGIAHNPGYQQRNSALPHTNLLAECEGCFQ